VLYRISQVGPLDIEQDITTLFDISMLAFFKMSLSLLIIMLTFRLYSLVVVLVVAAAAAAVVAVAVPLS